DQAVPQRAAGRAGARHRRLMQLDLAVAAPLHDDEVVELDLMGRLRPADVGHDLLRGREIVIADRDEVAHTAPLGWVWPDRAPRRRRCRHPGRVIFIPRAPPPRGAGGPARVAARGPRGPAASGSKTRTT